MTGSDDLQTLLEGLTFPEAPRWHEGRLWCSDFYSHRVLAVDERGHAETIVRVPQQPSGLGWTPAGTLRVVSMLDRRLLALEDGALRTVADLSALAGGPCNDMVLDATGRAYVGNFGFDRSAGEPERPAALVRVDADGRVTRVADDLHFPNGTVLTTDGRTLIVAETYAGRLTAFDLVPDGALAGRRVFAQIDDCRPDGICLDAEGAVWVADPGGCRLLRVFEGGRIAHALPLAGRRPYACMLGGTDRRTLYVCTSTGSGPAMADKTDGRIEFMRVAVPGAGLP